MTMNRRIGAIILLAIGMVTARAFAQATTSLDAYSPADLMAMEKKLAQKADASGLAYGADQEIFDGITRC